MMVLDSKLPFLKHMPLLFIHTHTYIERESREREKASFSFKLQEYGEMERVGIQNKLKGKKCIRVPKGFTLI